MLSPFFFIKKKENSVEDVQIKACEITSCILCICSLFCLQKLQKQFLEKEQKHTHKRLKNTRYMQLNLPIKEDVCLPLFCDTL